MWKINLKIFLFIEVGLLILIEKKKLLLSLDTEICSTGLQKKFWLFKKYM